eukprot:CAMPEP_0170560126 /NCGR_PEP_ID=MMETSP0211-20121228/47169_1 /TAXON_ID=311385 /ORGANISM="Pseudokeronopsis sp., Strain OXSARD2" /LENGTH=119 /DNA_ID=CAMNT_0010873965 /DNA_START=880 /DNA_END=1241 /DNA_ORIENTATION=-
MRASGSRVWKSPMKGEAVCQFRAPEGRHLCPQHHQARKTLQRKAIKRLIEKASLKIQELLLKQQKLKKLKKKARQKYLSNKYETVLNRSIGILHAYGELDNFIGYQKQSIEVDKIEGSK